MCLCVWSHEHITFCGACLMCHLPHFRIPVLQVSLADLIAITSIYVSHTCLNIGTYPVKFYFLGVIQIDRIKQVNILLNFYINLI